MVADDWKSEISRLMEIFQSESTASLRKINRCFAAIGRPFDEIFRQDFLQMSTLRYTLFACVV